MKVFYLPSASNNEFRRCINPYFIGTDFLVLLSETMTHINQVYLAYSGQLSGHEPYETLVRRVTNSVYLTVNKLLLENLLNRGLQNDRYGLMRGLLHNTFHLEVNARANHVTELAQDIGNRAHHPDANDEIEYHVKKLIQRSYSEALSVNPTYVNLAILSLYEEMLSLSKMIPIHHYRVDFVNNDTRPVVYVIDQVAVYQ